MLEMSDYRVTARTDHNGEQGRADIGVDTAATSNRRAQNQDRDLPLPKTRKILFRTLLDPPPYVKTYDAYNLLAWHIERSLKPKTGEIVEIAKRRGVVFIVIGEYVYTCEDWRITRVRKDRANTE